MRRAVALLVVSLLVVPLVPLAGPVAGTELLENPVGIWDRHLFPPGEDRVVHEVWVGVFEESLVPNDQGHVPSSFTVRTDVSCFVEGELVPPFATAEVEVVPDIRSYTALTVDDSAVQGVCDRYEDTREHGIVYVVSVLAADVMGDDLYTGGRPRSYEQHSSVRYVPRPAPPDPCDDLEATVIGDAFDNVLYGTSGADVIHGLGGNDVIRGLGGDDILCGGDGNDTIIGGSGDDRMFGGPGDDLLKGGRGNDVAVGGEGQDRLQGNADLDQLYGGIGDDRLWGGTGRDDLVGGEGRDQLHGNSGPDILLGGADTDRMWGNAGSDWLEGGDRSDFLYGGIDDDWLWGGLGNDRLFGGSGDDLLHGEAGNDRLRGQDGDDFDDGGSGFDWCVSDGSRHCESGTASVRSLPAPSTPLNVLFITADDLGLQLGTYGDEVAVTPHMDELADGGVQFNNAYVAQASCSPSRSAMFTGLYVHTNGHYGLASPSGPELHPYLHDALMPNILKRAGYHTGIVGKIHVKPEDKFQFDERLHLDDRDVVGVAEFADQLMRNAADAGKPFFLMANYEDPHVDRVTDPETGQRGPAFFPIQVNGIPETVIEPSEFTLLPFQGVDSPEQRVRVAAYYNAVQRFDVGVGLLLEMLEANGHADDTLVILIGDHGPAFDRAKTTAYEAGLRVPFLVRWPGVSQPMKTDALVSSVDILPTVLDAAQAEPVVPLQGTSLRSIISNPAAEWRQYLVGEYHMHHLDFYPRRAIRDDRYKLIHNLLAGTLTPRHRGTGGDQGYKLSREPRYDGTDVRRAFDTAADPPEFEFYDLLVDPWEFNNLAGQEEYREVQERLTRALTEWREATADPFLDPDVLAEFHEQLNGMSQLVH